MKMVSIVLPVYNNTSGLERGLPALTALLREHVPASEVLIVDDGSAREDRIRSLASQYQCKLIRHSVNSGKGMAVKSGFKAASGDFLIFMDGDFPFDLSVIPTMVASLQTNSIVIGDRTLPASSYPAETVLQRKIGSRILSWIISRFYIKGIRDSQCGIKGFRAGIGKAIFERVSMAGFSFDVEALFIAHRNHITIAKIPVHVFPQEQTSVRVLKDGLLMLLNLIRILWNNTKGKYTFYEQEMD